MRYTFLYFRKCTIFMLENQNIAFAVILVLRVIMKLLKIFLSWCATTIIACAASSCAPTAKSEGTGGYIDDTVITTKVKIALLNNKNIKSSEISVETFKGRVQLSGFITSNKDAICAVEITRGVAGVQSVKNVMQLK